MLLADIGSVRAQLERSPVFADPLWEREASEVTPVQLTLFRARMASHGLSREGDEAVDVLQSETLKALLDGELRNDETAFLSATLRPRFLVDQLVAGMKQIGHVRAQAVLLGLEQRQSPKWVMSLTWSEVLQCRDWTPLSLEILRSRNQCRHIRLGYVFWVFASAKIASPLLDFETQAALAFGMHWQDLQDSYDTMAMISSISNSEDFGRNLAKLT